MKSEAEFDQLYQSQLVPALEPLERSRKIAVTAFWLAITWLAAAGACCVIATMIGHPAAFLLLIPPIIMAFIKFSDHGKKKAAYVLEFKEKVIRALVKMIDPGLDYNPQSSISMDEYTESDIFRQRIDRYSGDDLVNGKLGMTVCKFSELQHLEKQVTYDSKGNRHESWVTIFKGIFFIADFNKNFNGRTYVLPDAGSSFFGIGKLFEKWTMGRGELVKLEDPVFEKYFTVYGTDQIEALYILSPSLMDRLVKYQQKISTRLHLSFIHSRVFVALSINKELFEPNIFSSGVRPDYLKEYFGYLELVTAIVDDLNLNTRIWGKQ